MHTILKNNFLILIDFNKKKFYHEWDNELPTLEGGIPFLGQSLKVSKNEEPVEREDNSSKNKIRI